MGQLAIAVGIKIRTERKARNLSQDALALACGIDRSYMGRIERGEVNLTIEKLYIIAGVLACNLNTLLPDGTDLKSP
jgi:transcriptional regulator with XRE-family HTH domain